MIDSLFQFEMEEIPLPVAGAATGLIALFVIGIPIRLVIGF